LKVKIHSYQDFTLSETRLPVTSSEIAHIILRHLTSVHHHQNNQSITKVNFSNAIRIPN